MEAAVRKHVSMILQYSTSTVLRISFQHFMELVQAHFVDNQLYTDLDASHPVSRLIVTTGAVRRFPDENSDSWVYLALDESYVHAEQYLSTHLTDIPLDGIGLDPHATTLTQLTEATVDAAIDQGLFTTAILVLDSMLGVRKPVLQACLSRRLTECKATWKPAVIKQHVAAFTIISLTHIKRLLPEVTTIILDMGHLLGSIEHHQWVRWVQKHCIDKGRAMTVLAVGWRNVPNITPGWGLNDFISHSAVEDMLTLGPWRRNPTGAPRFRTHAALLKMNTALSKEGRGFVLLSRGTSDSFEAARCTTMRRAFNACTGIVGLNDLPLWLMRQQGAVIMVLMESIAAKMNLDHWMLLMSHGQEAFLVLAQDEMPGTDALDPAIPPLDMIQTWIHQANKKPVRIYCTVPIHKTSPW